MTQAAFDALYREHYGAVLGLCRRMLGGAADAEDAAQEVFMRGYRGFGQYRADEPFAPWIGAIARNYCMDLLRRRRRLGGVFSPAADEPSANEASAADPGETGPDILISEYQAEAVNQAVEALPEKYRLPIVLAYYADASYEEIAGTLDTTPSHVGVLLFRGKEQLRKALARSSAAS